MTRRDLEIPEDALNRLHHAINSRRKNATNVIVAVEDLKALLYAAQKIAGNQPQTLESSK